MRLQTFFFGFIALFLSFAASAQCGSGNYSSSHHNNARATRVSFHGKDIVDIAASNDQFNTLVVAVKTAGLVNTLKSDGPFTVFAPTNAAFAKIPEATLKSLLQPEGKDALTKILTYHVVAGEFTATDVITAIKSSGGEFTIKTVSGDKLVASLSGDTVILTDEKGGISAITKTDIDASNGVIHVIDSVVIPN